jgi:hypothetical protein
MVIESTMELDSTITSRDLLANERAARALAIAGRALIEASNALLSKPSASLDCGATLLPAESVLTVNELANEFLLAKARDGKGDRYLCKLRGCLVNFCRGRARTPINHVSVSDLQIWIESNAPTNRTRRANLAFVRTMFKYAVQRGYLDSNPADDMHLLDQLAGKGLSLTEVASVILNAAVEAVRKNKSRVNCWPQKLAVEA